MVGGVTTVRSTETACAPGGNASQLRCIDDAPFDDVGRPVVRSAVVGSETALGSFNADRRRPRKPMDQKLASAAATDGAVAPRSPPGIARLLLSYELGDDRQRNDQSDYVHRGALVDFASHQHQCIGAIRHHDDAPATHSPTPRGTSDIWSSRVW